MEVYLDCLTDGSEYTGGPAIFLTLRKSSSGGTGKETADGPILARYNLTGLPSLTGRLASDQSYRLLSGGCFRCILLPSLSNCGGLAALFLDLVQYGYKVLNPTITDGDDDDDSVSSLEHHGQTSMAYGDVSIIGPQNTLMLVDGVLDVLFGNTRRRPSIRVCEIPLNDDNDWWDVYQDSYIRVWAQMVSNCCSCKGKKRKFDTPINLDDQLVVYIAMIKSHLNTTCSEKTKSDSVSFAILPHGSQCKLCGQKNICTDLVWNKLRNLPQEVVGATKMRKDMQKHHLEFILHLDHHQSDHYWKTDVKNELTVCPKTNTVLKCNVKQTTKHMVEVPQWAKDARISCHHFITVPKVWKEMLDPGILIRAQSRSRLLNRYLPFAFPLVSYPGNTDVGINNHPKNDGDERNINFLHVQSCSSILLNQDENVILSRRIFNEETRDASCVLDSELMTSLRRAFTHGNDKTGAPVLVDDNEISLDDSSSPESYNDAKEVVESNDLIDVCELDETSPHLLLLGTGCATPSPLRGSSSYALFMPTSTQSTDSKNSTRNNCLVLTAIIECGEGTLTSLSRHLLKSSISDTQLTLEEQLRWVQLIWISHSHLDHYGDIASVVHAISESKKKQLLSDPLLVIAPSKVLRFLDVMLGSARSKHAASSRATPSYVGITHREFQSSPFASSIRSNLLDYALPTQSLRKTEHTIGVRSTYRPFISVRNVEVEHCKDAFALILEIQVLSQDSNQNQESFVLCFSGDTRPSNNLVHACRSHYPPQQTGTDWQRSSLPPPPPPRISLLLHEATFLHDEHGRMSALKKRHSTVYEALNIAEQMQVEACVLTHFSQRYTHVSVSDVKHIPGDARDVGSSEEEATDTHLFPWTIGIDGMAIPLNREATSMLHHLSIFVDELLLK